MTKKKVVKTVASPAVDPTKRYISFAVMDYPEDEGWNNPILRCEAEGWPCAYIIHDRDTDDENEGKKAHCHMLIRVKHGMTVSAFAKKFGVAERFVQGCNDYKAFTLYLTHSDYDSVRAGKYQYASDEIKGSFADEARRIIDNYTRENTAQSHEDDRNILEILDFIDSCSSVIPTSSLCRWCCQMGFFSTYRRCSGIIRDALREHNQLSSDTVEALLLRKKVKYLEEKVNEQDRELEKAYGDLFERIRNPFDGRILNSGDEPKRAKEESIWLLNQQIADLKAMSKSFV